MSGYDSLSLDLLQSKDQAALLDRIDQLSNLGFHHRLSLPQLVLCGDQNSGKSSVFEAITGVKLPTSDELHAHFATEVVLRRSSEICAHVKIRPGPNASPDHKHKLEIFSRPCNWIREIPKIFSEARLVMGLTFSGGYSQDVLHLEISGPTMPNLTVVDLPGLIHRPGRRQTLEDVATVKRLTESYMRNPRSIVLAVVSAENQLSQQNVLQLANCCASRTIVIVTKLDILEQNSSNVDTFYNRAKRQDTPLRLGWHLLRNVDTKASDTHGLSRDNVENLFFTSIKPWKYLSPNAVGVDALRNRLSKILLSQVELQLSMLASEIQKDLEINRTLLEKLGPSKSSGHEQRLHLTRIGEKFQSIATGAVLGEYRDPYFRYHPNHAIRRLRSAIGGWAEEFAYDMRSRGHSYHIHDDGSSEFPHVPPIQLSPDDPQPVTKSKYIASLADELQESTGHEISGLTNQQIVGEIFLRYSVKWDSMAKAHVSQIWKKVKQFLDDLLHYIADSGVGEAILQSVISDEMEKKLEKLHQKIDELLSPYKRPVPSTLNSELNARIRRARCRTPELQDTNEAQSNNIDYDFCSELLDCMHAYYSVALNTFVDNVAGLAVENCLVDGIEDFISPSKIAQMSDEEIERLAIESEDVTLARNTISKKVEVLEIAAATCTRCQMLALGSVASHHRATSSSSNAASSTTESDYSSSRASSSTLDTEKTSPSPVPPMDSKPSRRNTTNGQRPGHVPSRSLEIQATELPVKPAPELASLSRPFSPPPKGLARSKSLSVDCGRMDSIVKNPKPTKRRTLKTRSDTIFEEGHTGHTPWKYFSPFFNINRDLPRSHSPQLK